MEVAHPCSGHGTATLRCVPNPRRVTMGPMPGAIAIIIVLVIAIPVGVLISGGVASALLGHLVKRDVDASHAGSELLDTNI